MRMGIIYIKKIWKNQKDKKSKVSIKTSKISMKSLLLSNDYIIIYNIKHIIVTLYYKLKGGNKDEWSTHEF